MSANGNDLFAYGQLLGIAHSRTSNELSSSAPPAVVGTPESMPVTPAPAQPTGLLPLVNQGTTAHATHGISVPALPFLSYGASTVSAAKLSGQAAQPPVVEDPRVINHFEDQLANAAEPTTYRSGRNRAPVTTLFGAQLDPSQNPFAKDASTPAGRSASPSVGRYS